MWHVPREAPDPVTGHPLRASAAAALVDRPGATGPVAPVEVRNAGLGAPTERGVDTWRLLFAADASGVGRRVFDLADGYVGQWFPEHGTLAVEGHPAGRGDLADPSTLGAAFDRVAGLVEPYGATFKGVSRSDLTAGYRFAREQDGRAFFAGMAAVDLPRCETTRRGSPVHSVWWTGAKGREIKGRVYDKGLERGTADAFLLGRLEDQRRYPSGARVPVDVLGDQSFIRERFAARFDPVRKAVDGVKCASIPVIGQALADEARYGYRSWKEAERLAGSLILLAGGAGEAYTRSTFYERRAKLREAGYVVADSWMEPVEVDLGEVVESVVESW